MLGIRPIRKYLKELKSVEIGRFIPQGFEFACRSSSVAQSLDSKRNSRRCSFDELLDGARAGEEWAFRALFDALSSPVAAFVRSRVDSDVDDLVNEIFLGAFKGLERFEGGVSDYRAWVFRIARNKINDSHRRGYRRVEQSELDTEGSSQRSIEAELDFATQEQREQIDRMLEPLSPDQRDVILLRVVADLSIEQVATILEKPPGAIKSLQHRALETLRRNSLNMAVSI